MKKIEFDSEKDRELFQVMLDNFIGMVEPEPDEQEFINKVYEASRK